jgi:hypothetical protein
MLVAAIHGGCCCTIGCIAVQMPVVHTAANKLLLLLLLSKVERRSSSSSHRVDGRAA